MPDKRKRCFSAEPISDEEFEQRMKFVDKPLKEGVKLVRATIAGHTIHDCDLSDEEVSYLINTVKAI